MPNKNQTSNKISTLASGVLRNPNASKIQKSLAGTVLSQSNKNR